MSVIEILHAVTGNEAHVLWTDPFNALKPSFLILNRVDAAGTVLTQAFPIIKPTIANDDPAKAAKEANEKWNPRTIFDPQYSPDGQRVVFKFGNPASPGTYRIYVLDTVSGKTKLACASYLSYYALSWSPDGNYIAFGRGGETDPRMYDYGRNPTGKLQLCLVNWRTGAIQVAADDSTLRGPWTWKAPHTLLYGELAPADQAFLNDSRYEKGIDFANGKPAPWERLRGGEKRKPVTPNIYEYSIEAQRSRLLAQDGYLPVASPDGKHLAFFGSSDTAHPPVLDAGWQDQPRSFGSFVVVTNADGSNPNVTDPKSSVRTSLSQHYGSYPDLVWLLDGRHLLVLQQVARSPHGRLEIKDWDVQERTSRLVATLSGTDPDEARSENEPMFRPLNLSDDGKRLMIDVNECRSLGERKGCINQDTLQQVDLQTGSVIKVGRVQAAVGLDWHYPAAKGSEK